MPKFTAVLVTLVVFSLYMVALVEPAVCNNGQYECPPPSNLNKTECCDEDCNYNVNGCCTSTENDWCDVSDTLKTWVWIVIGVGAGLLLLFIMCIICCVAGCCACCGGRRTRVTVVRTAAV